MNAYVAITDQDWYRLLTGLPPAEPDEVNFWTPSPWGLRQERWLREESTPEEADGARSTAWGAPEPLDPIDEDEIDLVVWMGVLASGVAAAVK